MLTKYTHYIIFPMGKTIQFRASEDKEQGITYRTLLAQECYHINTRSFKFNPIDIQRNSDGRGKGAELVSNIQF